MRVEKAPIFFNISSKLFQLTHWAIHSHINAVINVRGHNRDDADWFGNLEVDKKIACK